MSEHRTNESYIRRLTVRILSPVELVGRGRLGGRPMSLNFSIVSTLLDVSVGCLSSYLFVNKIQ